MQNLLWFSLSMKPAGDVHSAARVRQDQGGGAACFEIGDLALEHFSRELRVFHGEDSTEPAAIIAGGKVHDFSALHSCQKRTWLPVHTEVSIQVAGSVVG